MRAKDKILFKIRFHVNFFFDGQSDSLILSESAPGRGYRMIDHHTIGLASR